MNFYSLMLRLLFYPAPKIVIYKEEETQFDIIYETALVHSDRLIEYNSEIPKVKFIKYISQHKSLVLHGSNNSKIKDLHLKCRLYLMGLRLQLSSLQEIQFGRYFMQYFRERV